MRRAVPAAALLAALAVTTLCSCVSPPVDRDQLSPSSSSPTVNSLLSDGDFGTARQEQVTNGARAAVVRVRNQTCDGLGTGSGWVLGARTLVTNAHVVRGAMHLTVDTTDGRTRTVTVAATTEGEDLAIVHTAEDLAGQLPLATNDPVPGDLVEALGFPLGGPFAASPGRIIELVDGAPYDHVGMLLGSSVQIQPGNSGGPLLDRLGRVVRVIFAIDLRTGNALAISVSRLRHVLEAAPRATVNTNCATP